MHVHQHKVVGQRFQCVDGFRAVGHSIHPQSQFLENAAGNLLVGDVVFGQQDANRAPAHLAKRVVRGDGLWLFGRMGSGQYRGHAAYDLSMSRRFDQVGVEPDLPHAFGVLAPPQGREKHQAGVFDLVVILDGASQCLAIHARHLHVQDGYLEWITGLLGQVQRLQSRGAALRLFRAHAPGLELDRQHLAIGDVVIDHQDVNSLNLGGRRRSASPFGLLGKTQGEPEIGTFAFFAVDTDLTTHDFGELLGDGQSQPSTAVHTRGGGVHLGKLLKQVVAPIGRNPDAGVLDGKADQGVLVGFRHQARAYRDFALLGELDSVAGQVDEHLAQAPGVAA